MQPHQQQGRVLEDPVRVLLPHLREELDHEQPALSVHPQLQRLVQAALQRGDLRLQPAADLHPRPRLQQRRDELLPAWICEVLSPRTASVDQGQKRLAYHAAGVEHCWLVDPTNGTLTVLERAERDYLIVLVAGREEVVRAPPFDAVEIPVAEIFGDDEAGEEAERG